MTDFSTNISKSFSVADVELSSRFFLGTSSYPSPQVLQQAIAASGAQVVTVGLKRQLAAASASNTAPNDNPLKTTFTS